eukprot:1160108-Pelagomonas_calceolata.AAC.4
MLSYRPSVARTITSPGCVKARIPLQQFNYNSISNDIMLYSIASSITSTITPPRCVEAHTPLEQFPS